MSDTTVWTIVLLLGGTLLTLVSKGIADLKNNAWVKSHAAAEKIADIADDICNSAMALLTANPTLTPQAAATWALNELKASAPDLITDAGALATNAGLSYMVTRKLVTAAQAAPLSDAATGVISALAPSAATARVTPAEIVTATTAAASAVPDIESIVAAVIAKMTAPKTTTTPDPVTAPMPVAPSVSVSSLVPSPPASAS